VTAEQVQARSTSSQARGPARWRVAGVEPAAMEVAAPPRLRRRPVLVVVSVLATCLGALVSAWAYTSVSSSREVVAVRSTVLRGEVITAEDVMTVRIGVDPALAVVAGEAMESVVGKRAAADLPAGGLVTPEALTDTVVPGRGRSVVGLGLPGSLLPGEELLPGDPVRVVATPGEQGDVVTGVQPFVAATVVVVRADADSGLTLVTLEVPYADAAELAARAATGKVALVLDSRER
jgi:hypothetical protein